MRPRPTYPNSPVRQTPDKLKYLNAINNIDRCAFLAARLAWNPL